MYIITYKLGKSGWRNRKFPKELITLFCLENNIFQQYSNEHLNIQYSSCL